MNIPFRITFKDEFYAYHLYDKRGREVFTLTDAIDAANAEFDDDWQTVYNGYESFDREDFSND